MTTSADTSRRAFLAGSAVAAGGLLLAGRLVATAATRILTGQTATTGVRVEPYMFDLPQPPTEDGPG